MAERERKVARRRLSRSSVARVLWPFDRLVIGLLQGLELCLRIFEIVLGAMLEQDNEPEGRDQKESDPEEFAEQYHDAGM